MRSLVLRLVSFRSALFAAICVCAFAFWEWGRSSVLFLDDPLFQFSSFLDAHSPLDFFLTSSGFFKAWPLGATLIWCLARLGLNSLAVLKTAVFLVHIFNAILFRRLIRDRERATLFSLLYLFHPALFLTLSWAWQLGTMASLSFLLGALIAIRGRTFRSSSSALGLYLASLLIKPWAVLFLPYFFVVIAVRARSNRLQLGLFAAMSIFVGVFVFRAWSHAQFNAETFPMEAMSNIEFRTGSTALRQEPSRPLQFDALREHIESIPTELTVLQSTLNSGHSAARYFVMATGFEEPIVQPRASLFDATDVLGFAVVATFAVILILRFRDERWVFAITVLTAAWLPHAGLVYIPHFKFSYASPHYFAVMLPGFLLCLEAFAGEFKSPWIPRALIALAVFFAARQSGLYWKLNHDVDAQTKACPVLISPWRGC